MESVVVVTPVRDLRVVVPGVGWLWRLAAFRLRVMVIRSCEWRGYGKAYDSSMVLAIVVVSQR